MHLISAYRKYRVKDEDLLVAYENTILAKIVFSINEDGIYEMLSYFEADTKEKIEVIFPSELLKSAKNFKNIQGELITKV